MALLQDALGLLRRDVDLQRGRHGGVDEAADDGGDLLLDGGLVAVGMTEVLSNMKNDKCNETWTPVQGGGRVTVIASPCSAAPPARNARHFPGSLPSERRS